MRSDMHKVIVERPRVAHYGSWVPAQAIKRGRNLYRKAKQFKLLDGYDVVDDFCGEKLPMKSKHLGFRVKMFNENLKPLWRFLRKRVGVRWDDVYSEICKGLKGSPTLQQHVLLHVSFDVDVNAQMTDDGRIVSSDGLRSSCEAGRSFYVHPVTRVLCCGTACPF